MLVSQIDLMATFAAMLDVDLPDDAAEDSHDMLPYLRGDAEMIRQSHVHNTRANQYAIRDGNWLLIDADTGYLSRGWQAWEERRDYPADNDLPVELYDLLEDPGQRHNLAADHPEKVEQLQDLLKQIRDAGRTRE